MINDMEIPERKNQKATVRFPNGFVAKVKSEDGRPLNKARVYETLAKSQRAALAELTAGNPYPTKVVQTSLTPSATPSQVGFQSPYKKVPNTDLTKKQHYDKFYKEKLSVILQIPKSKFDFETGLSEEIPRAEPLPRWARSVDPMSNYYNYLNQEMGIRTGLSDRAKYGYMQDTNSKVGFLVKEFGKENVAVYKTQGSPLILWRENEEDTWKFPEGSNMIEMADFTADIASEIIPTASSVLAGIPSIASSPLASTVVASATYGAVGGLQDYLVEKDVLGEADIAEIFGRRAKQSALMGAIEYPTLKIGGKFVNAFLGRQGTDLFNETMTEFTKIADANVQLPRTPFLQQGYEIAQEAKRMEVKFPNGPIAKSIDEYRNVAGETFEGTINPSKVTSGATDDGIRNGMDHIVASLERNRTKLLQRLEQLKREAELANDASKAKLMAEAQRQAQEAFNLRVANYQRNVLSQEKISPALGGEIAQRELAESFIDVNIVKSRNFNEAYESLSNLDISVQEFNSVLNKTSSDLINDISEEAVGVINANARVGAGNVLKRLDDLAEAGGSLDFKTVNEVIQKIEEKTRRGASVPGFDANAYRALADDLRVLRSKMLESPTADPQGVAQFEFANTFYRDNYLPYIDLEPIYKPKIGQSYSDAIQARANGQEGFVPPFSMKRDEVLGKVIENSGTIEEFLKLTGNKMATRKLLRDFWLQSKGLKAGSPIDIKKITDMSEADMDTVRVLWNEGQQGGSATGVAGWNDKVNVFEDLGNLIKEQEDFVADLSATTFERLMNASSKSETQALAKIAREEVLINQRLAKHSETLVKLAGEGRIPLPENRVQMTTFLKGLQQANPKEQEKFIKVLMDNDPSLLIDLRGALFYDMVRISKAKSPMGTKATSPKDNLLWDAESMVSELEKNSDLLNKLIGTEDYNKLVALNNSLRELSRMDYSYIDSIKPRVALTPKGGNVWIGNVTAPISDRFGALFMNAQINSPFPITKMLSPEGFDTAQTTLLRSLFLTTRGLSMLNSEAEVSPEFSDWLGQNMQSIRDEIKLRQEQQAEGVEDVVAPEPNKVGRTNFGGL